MISRSPLTLIENTRYLAIFLTKQSREKLLAAIPPAHSKVIADHVTVKVNPTEDEIEQFPEGEMTKFQVTGVAQDNAVQAVSVRGVKSAKKNPHITISVAPGHKAAESDKLLASKRPKMLKTFVLTGTYKAVL